MAQPPETEVYGKGLIKLSVLLWSPKRISATTAMGKKRPHDIILEGRPIQVARNSKVQRLASRLRVGALANYQNGNARSVIPGTCQNCLILQSPGLRVDNYEFYGHYAENGKRRFERGGRDGDESYGEQDRPVVVDKPLVVAEDQDV